MPLRDNLSISPRKYKYNLFDILDMIQVLRENRNLINPSEEDLVDAERTSRLILRRKIKESFPSFNVRKNKYDYALRIDDDELYNNFRKQKLLENITQFRNMVSEEIIDEIQTCLGERNTAFKLINQSYGIRHEVKPEGRLFIYFDFVLAGKNMDRPNNNSLVLRERSLKAVIDKIPSIRKSLDDKLELTGYPKKVYELVKIFPTRVIFAYNMEEITKDFLDYVDSYELTDLDRPRRSLYRTIVSDYRDWKEQREKEDREDDPPINLVNSENPSSNEDLQARFDAALRQVMANRET